MQAGYLLPLYPLEGLVLLPTMQVEVTPLGSTAHQVLRRAHDHGNVLVASFYEEEAVHEVGVKARVVPLAEKEGSVIFYGLQRCRLRRLVQEEVPMVMAEDFPDTGSLPTRAEPLRRLLLRRVARLCARLPKEAPQDLWAADLETLTWRLTSLLALSVDQQQGLLNVPDALTRGRILLLALRDAERRERFLRPFASLRHGGQWN